MILRAFKGAPLAALCGVLAATLPVATPAHADVLIDNVNGIRIDEDGDIDRFTGLWVEDDGTIIEVLDRRDKRPERPTYLSDMKGQIIVPGMIDAHLHVMGIGFGALIYLVCGAQYLDTLCRPPLSRTRTNPNE
mgnify:CR=1 FL=1